jgi:hypothetical protein
MTNYIQWDALKNEIITYLRNWDIFTITQRGVTTSSVAINKNNVRNIRSLVVGSTTLSFGLDYQVNYTNQPATSNQNCLITFTAPQTGAYTITYDFGTDAIFTDYPDSYLTVSQFPRMTFDYGPSPSKPGGLGNVVETDIYLAITCYALNANDLESYATILRKKFIENWKTFYYTKSRLIQPVGNSPATPYSNSNSKKVLQKTVEFKSPFNYEINN